MSKVAEERKSALLFHPERIPDFSGILQSLFITKGAAGISFERFPLDRQVIEACFPTLPESVRDLFMRFSDDDLKFEFNQIKKIYKKQKGGISLDVTAGKALTRYLAEQFRHLSTQQEQVRLYHNTINPKTGNLLLAPCKIRTEKATLGFEVSRSEEGHLWLKTLVTAGGQQRDIRDYLRFTFLLAIGHDYIPISYNDHLTLQWLDARRPEQYKHDPALLAERILTELEKNYPVKRNDLFDVKTITVAPVPCIYLSEINDTFLMFTPRWNYEGIILEGPWQASQEVTRQGEIYVVNRDKQTEEAFFTALKELHAEFRKQLMGYFYLSFSEAKKKNWFLKVYHELLERGIEIVGLDMLRHFRYSPFPIVTDIQIKDREETTLHLSMTVSFGKERINLSELQKLLISGQKSILLKDNSIGVFTDEWLQQYGTILRHGKLRDGLLQVPQWILLSVEKEDEDKQLRPAIPAEWWEKWQRWQDLEETVYPIPTGIGTTLRSYQHKGFEWLTLLSEIGAGACLADDMGLGKTLQTITFLTHLLEQKPVGRHLIVCPASLLYNWKSEFAKFAPEVRVSMFNELDRNVAAFVNGNAQVLIASYGAVRAGIEELKILQWDAAVLDESQNIKNPAAQITRAVCQLSAKYRLALSGTPVMNNTFDLYAQLQFLLPGLFGSQEFFRKEYANPIDRDGDKEKVLALRQITAPFILRRTKQQVATDLPPKTESILWCEMDDDQKAYYEKVKESIRDSVFLSIKKEGMGKSKLNILQGILKLRQICCSPLLLKDEDRNTDASVKLDVLMDELKNNLRGNKALVFSQFKGMLHLIADACKKEGIPYYHFDGDTPVAQRQEMVSSFQEEGNEVGVFLISLKSGNAGLNLTAADYVFLVDPWWNTAVQQQAIDRTHRIGQTKSVFAYQMICRDSIEERIISMQQAKKTISEELISEDDAFVKNLSVEDVAYLFG